METMWKEMIEILGTVLVALGGWEFVKWMLTRKSNARKASAEADKADIEAKSGEFAMLKDIITFTQDQLKQKEERFAEQTTRLRKKQDEFDTLRKDYCDLELREQKYHCELANCPKRQPPNGY